MTKIDQFESIFRAASKEKFEPEEVRVDRVLVITDKGTAESQPFLEEVQAFLNVFSGKYNPEWKLVAGEAFSSVDGLLGLVSQHQPDLICTYRNLHIPATEFPYSLGVYVDVLTQATTVPILLMPRLELQSDSETRRIQTGTAKVMAITDHLAGDHLLVNVAAKLVRSGGKLLLTHVEDQYYFERFLSVIDKIADIDSDIAKESIMAQLLAEPRDYIESCRQVIEKSENVEVESIVTVGHLMQDHRRIIEDNDVDLLILHTKDDDQLAMHGLAYPLAVELRTIPMLMI
jgi:hypothetical protein